MNKKYKNIGKRKNASVKAYIKLGAGNIFVNNQIIENYFKSIKCDLTTITQILEIALLNKKLDIFFFASGGGLNGQFQACQLALAKALVKTSPNLISIFKKYNFLTQDSRIKERRKYGLKKARKASQYSKR